MTKRWIVALCLVVMVFHAAKCLAQSGYRLDIDVQGPWIFYEDKTFAAHPVLVMVAPDVGSESKHNAFHFPQISTGDGYPIKKNGIYCLTFDSECGKAVGSKLDRGNYSDSSKLLHAKFKLTALVTNEWDWISASKTGIVIILPIPNSYSDDGDWHMRFANKYNSQGKGYQAHKDSPRHPIGVQLHYDVGPAMFNLRSCKNPQPTAVNCTAPAAVHATHTRLDNTGTLRIQMKAPNIDDFCDYHVRRVYPRMLKLLDSTPLISPDNVNYDKAFIDPARGEDADSNPIYKDKWYHNCLAHDPQKDELVTEQVQNVEHEMMSMNEEEEPAAKTLQSTFQALDTTINNLAHDMKLMNNCDEYDKSNDDGEGKQQDDPFEKCDIENEINSLDPDFPRLSQLARIQQLLHLSAKNARDLGEKPSNLAYRPRLLALETSENLFAAAFTKNGNDCLAPIILAGP
jgi:hypothetical protein